MEQLKNMDKKHSNNCMEVTLSEMLYSRSQKVNDFKLFHEIFKNNEKLI